MAAQILNGKLVAQTLLDDIQSDISNRLEKGLDRPTLAVIVVGDNPASEHYVAHKEKACNKVGIESIRINLAADTSFENIKQTIIKCANNPNINGILLQTPLPNREMEAQLVEYIPPEKDVDGFHPYNVGRLALRQPLLRSCTPYGIIQLLNYYDLSIQGKGVVIIGASNIVGRPMMLECLNEGATVTVCHRHTKDLASQVAQADVCIVAIGNHKVIQAAWFKPGAIIIDVGFERDASGHIYGDVPFTEAKEIASWITPVPGGVGAMTVATLMKNTLEAAQLQD